METEEEFESALSPSRTRRAITLIVTSILAITVVAVVYLHPTLVFGSGTPVAGSSARPLQVSYQLAAVDFVSPATGWVVAEPRPGYFTVLHTTDTGSHWTRQLAGSTAGSGEYARFFDSSHGVVVLLGPQAVMFRTSDGGRTWSREAAVEDGAYVLSAAFVDAGHGWMLALGGAVASAPSQDLFRTDDGGRTWIRLGTPVLQQDAAYRVIFTDSNQGWLYSRSAGPYAYTSADGGATWRTVSLPAPSGGWPVAPVGSLTPEEFFVAAQPTLGAGVAATVVAVAPPNGRSAEGGIVVGYPPLTIRTFDGGGSITYTYTTLGDSTWYRVSSFESSNNAGATAMFQPADQVQFSSVDGGLSWRPVSTPARSGAIGYVDELHWWWIGLGAWSKSSDGGATWTPNRNLGVPEPLPGSLQVLDANHAWFGGMAGARPLLMSTSDGGIVWKMILLPAITP